MGLNMKDVKTLILDVLYHNGEVRTSDIVKKTGYSRAYVNRFFQKLRNNGKIVILGKANQSRYVAATKEAIMRAKGNILSINRMLSNKNISEDMVLMRVKQESGIFLNLPKNIAAILDYAFLEMLNNAIEHSQSKVIKITMTKEKEVVRFHVIDKGIGIFYNIMRKKKLLNDMEAIQDLLKGKLTTAAQTHSGEGIFFTSKVAGIFVIQSSRKQIIFNNFLKDIFIRDVKETKGTKIIFSVNLDSRTDITKVFKQYTDDSFRFSKTRVDVKLYKMAAEYISRSQARRVLSGLNKFKKIVLDFACVNVVGQGFADEIFRVWKMRYPDISIDYQNANENIEFMIKRALRRMGK